MIIITAKEKIAEKLIKTAECLNEAGLITKSRVYFTDARFIESADVTENSRLVFGELTVSAEGLEEDEAAIFVICAELVAGEVEDGALDEAIKEFDAEIADFQTELGSAPSKADAIKKINEKQQAEADAAAKEMMEELRIAKKKLFFGIGAIAVLIIGIVIAGSLL